MMLMLVRRPLYRVNSYTNIPHGRPHRLVKPAVMPSPARFVSATKWRKRRSRAGGRIG
jgi:hypothetical protein